MNQFLAAAPHAEVVHGELACMVSLNDLADRPPRPMADGEVLDTGAHRLRFLAHARTFRTTGRAGCGSTRRPRTLFAGDLFTTLGDGPAVDDRRASSTPAIGAEAMFHATSIGAATVPTLRAPRRPRPDDARADARLVVLG